MERLREGNWRTVVKVDSPRPDPEKAEASEALKVAQNALGMARCYWGAESVGNHHAADKYRERLQDWCQAHGLDPKVDTDSFINATDPRARKVDTTSLLNLPVAPPVLAGQEAA